MSELMIPIPFRELMTWVTTDANTKLSAAPPSGPFPNARSIF